ncbi:MAG: bifunctional nuclease family protein [Anaerolineaceae bacterium]|nr:bifunctional nuclease family protein [Anaerolineaceae bacterium]
MPRMVEVVLDSVRASLTNQQRIVMLREINVDRYLPIWIGPYEAEAITIALQEIEVARPQTHDLLKSILQTLSARLLRVEVIALREDVFYGNLVIEVGAGEIVNVDCRPSDALALAVRTHVPIMIALDVMETAGVVPAKDIENEPALSAPSAGKPELVSDETEARLEVFEDFLQKLDLDQPPGSAKDDSEDDEAKPSEKDID